jgi:hypothetical protein
MSRLVGGVVDIAVRTAALDSCYLADAAFNVEVCERPPDVAEFAPFLRCVCLLGRERQFWFVVVFAEAEDGA